MPKIVWNSPSRLLVDSQRFEIGRFWKEKPGPWFCHREPMQELWTSLNKACSNPKLAYLLSDERAIVGHAPYLTIFSTPPPFPQIDVWGGVGMTNHRSSDKRLHKLVQTNFIQAYRYTTLVWAPCGFVGPLWALLVARCFLVIRETGSQW